jgi:hypothetical protein
VFAFLLREPRQRCARFGNAALAVAGTALVAGLDHSRRLAAFPGGSECLTADEPTGVRYIVVNGTPIQVDGEHDPAAAPASW